MLRFSLSGGRLKQFRTTLAALKGIGSELLIEAFDDKLILRSISSSLSAFLAITFKSTFFEDFSLDGAQLVQAAVLSRLVIAALRGGGGPASGRVSAVDFQVNPDTETVGIVLRTDQGIVKRYTCPFLDSQILQAEFDTSQYPVHILALANVLDKLMGSFQSTLEEVTLVAVPLADGAAIHSNASKACQFRSFWDPFKAPPPSSTSNSSRLFTSQRLSNNPNHPSIRNVNRQPNQCLETRVAIDTRSLFLSYNHSGDSPVDVTFNLQDLRTFLALCEAMGANVSLEVEGPDSPLVARPSFRGGYKADAAVAEDYSAVMLLATLKESQLTEAVLQDIRNEMAVDERVARNQPTVRQAFGNVVRVRGKGEDRARGDGGDGNGQKRSESGRKRHVAHMGDADDYGLLNGGKTGIDGGVAVGSSTDPKTQVNTRAPQLDSTLDSKLGSRKGCYIANSDSSDLANAANNLNAMDPHSNIPITTTTTTTTITTITTITITITNTNTITNTTTTTIPITLVDVPGIVYIGAIKRMMMTITASRLEKMGFVPKHVR